MKLGILIDKEKRKCPYCSRKVSYGKRFVGKDKGEYKCKNCKKVSNIKHNINIWSVLILAATVSIIIMIFYLAANKGIQRIYDQEGKMGFFVALFFGDAMIFKWILWEMLPFVVFYFCSPAFVEFYPQKRYMEQTQTKIDLSVPSSVSSTAKINTSSSTRNIPKITGEVYTGEFEDISSSSDIEKTKSFRISDTQKQEENLPVEYADINKERTIKSDSYRSETPLVKVPKAYPVKKSEEDIKEYIPQKERINTESDVKIPAPKNPQNTNYSANRKF